MKDKILIIPIILLSFIFFSFIIPGDKTQIQNTSAVVLQFITVNGYGNNLYIDNVTAGVPNQYDIAALSIDNIAKDTTYSPYGNTSFKITPKTTFINIGTENITSSFNVSLEVSPGGYTSTKSISNLNSKTLSDVVFDSLTVAPNMQYTATLYCSLSNDEDRTNDTIRMNYVLLPGKSVLFQAFTSSTCGPCAANNPALDEYIAQRFLAIVPIKYHVWWPAPGNDPMFLENTGQIQFLTNYAGISAVPTLKVEGILTQVSNYGYNTLNPLFMQRVTIAPKIRLNVTDTRIPGDSIRADITVNIDTALAAGNYYLRVEAIERSITYTTAPGSNGEKVFFDVFRRAYPDSMGILIPTAAGTYNYQVTYYKKSNWADSNIYTAVYVQNHSTKEVLNSAKSLMEMVVTDNINFSSKNPNAVYYNPVLIKGEQVNYTDRGIFNLEMLEGAFPPAGWTIYNPDGGITFTQSGSANGKSYPGKKSVYMNFYSYSSQGQYDSMKTKTYTNLNMQTDTLKFDYAYAQYPGYSDRLIVKVSTDGGATFPFTIFDKTGPDLATAPATTSGFIPADTSQWRTIAYPLSNISFINPVSTEIPLRFELKQNYPNPFNPVTTINFSIPKNSAVRMRVYDILGKEMKNLNYSNLNAGVYNITLDMSGMNSGVYFYSLEAGSYKDIKKMILVK